MSWFAAKEHCEGEGGKLVEIDSEEENTALVDEINRRGFTDRNMNFWIGLNDLVKEGDWRLASSGLKPFYLNWHHDQPNNRGGNEHCARIRIGPDARWKDTWSVTNCNIPALTGLWTQRLWTMHALCEFNPSTESPSTEGTTTEDTKAESTATEGVTTKS